MDSAQTLENQSTTREYEETLGYLEYEDYSDKISIPIQLRERHLTPETEKVLLQAVGTHLHIAIFSDRDNILLRCPLKHWQTTKAYEGSLTGNNGGHIAVGRFEESLDLVEVPDDGKGIMAMVREINFEEP